MSVGVHMCVYECIYVCVRMYIIKGAVMTIPTNYVAGLTFQSDNEG